MRVLLVEDDASTAKSIELMLKSEAYIVDTTDLGEDGLDLGKIYDYDIIILDLMLPDMDGYEVLKRLRASKITTPILILSGLSELDNKIKGLGFGADDYLTKPFDVRELAARVRSLLRRPKQILPVELTIKGVSLDLKTRVVREGNNHLRLMPKECALLEFLMRHPDTIYSSKALLDSVWRSDSDSSEDTVRTCMRTLRLKLQKLGREDLIKTILGSGYIIEVAEKK